MVERILDLLIGRSFVTARARGFISRSFSFLDSLDFRLGPVTSGAKYLLTLQLVLAQLVGGDGRQFCRRNVERRASCPSVVAARDRMDTVTDELLSEAEDFDRCL